MFNVNGFQIRAYVAAETDTCESCCGVFPVGSKIFGLHETLSAEDGGGFDEEVFAVACSINCAISLAKEAN